MTSNAKAVRDAMTHDRKPQVRVKASDGGGDLIGTAISWGEIPGADGAVRFTVALRGGEDLYVTVAEDRIALYAHAPDWERVDTSVDDTAPTVEELTAFLSASNPWSTRED